MKQLRRAVFYLALAGVGLSTVTGQAAPRRDTAPPVWRAVAASGSVEARGEAQAIEGWRRVQRGDQLAGGTEIQTGSRGRVTLVREGAILIVDPQSRLVLPGTHVAGTASKVFQSSGRVLYQIESSRSGPFEVHAPSLIAGVKGTVFLVDVSTAESVVVVDRGLVGVTGRATREQVDVAAGKAAQLDRSGRLQRFEADEVDRGRRGQLARARELNQARDQAGWPQPERSGTPDPSTDHDADTDGEAEGEGPGQGHAWGRDRDEVGDPWGAAGEDGDASDHPGRGAGREEREAEDGSPGRRHGQSQGGGPPESGGDEDSSTGPGNASRGSGQGRGRGGSQ